MLDESGKTMRTLEYCQAQTYEINEIDVVRLWNRIVGGYSHQMQENGSSTLNFLN